MILGVVSIVRGVGCSLEIRMLSMSSVVLCMMTSSEKSEKLLDSAPVQSWSKLSVYEAGF